MSLALWFSLIGATVVISLTPGAGAINTMSTSLTYGWRRTFWAVLGLQIALLVHIAIVAAGVGLIVSQSQMLFNVIRYLGAAYLVYLGVRMLLTKPSPESNDATQARGLSRWNLVSRAFWVNMLNPKAIVFFLAFMPQFIRNDEPLVAQYVILIATVVIIDTAVMWGFFAVAARPFRRATATARGQRVLNSMFGALFIVVAALLLFIN